MVDSRGFRRCIGEICALSDRIADGWILDRRPGPEDWYICKKAKRQIDSRILTFEYHVLYNLSYSVPALFFNVYTADGAVLSDLEKLQPLLNIPNFSDGRYVLMQQEHPILHVPFVTFHPCKTGEIMETFAEKTKNPVVSWLSVIGPYAHLNLPTAFAKLT